MDGYPQIIFVPKQMRKILFLIFIISVLSFFIFWGANYTKINLASLFSVITARVTINPLEVKIFALAEIEVDKVFRVEAKVINRGEEKIENAKGEVFLPPGLILIQKDSVKEIGIIPGKREKKVSWSARGEAVGNYFISFKVSGELKEQIISVEDSILVEIKESIKNTGSRSRFQNFFDFFQERFGF